MCEPGVGEDVPPPSPPVRPPSRFVTGESSEAAPLLLLPLLPPLPPLVAPPRAPVKVLTMFVSGAAGLDVEVEEPPLLLPPPFPVDPPDDPPPAAPVKPLSRLVGDGLALPPPDEPPLLTGTTDAPPSKAVTGASRPPEVWPAEPLAPPEPVFDPADEPFATPLPLPLPLLLPIVIGTIGTLTAPTLTMRFAIGLSRPLLL